MFGFFKKELAVKGHPEPEVELRRLFVELLGETKARLSEVQDAVNHFVMMFDVDERIVKKGMSSGRERAAQVADNLAHIEKLFAMAEGHEKQGMHDTSVEVKLVALYLACNIMDCSFEQKAAQNEAIMLFETFKQSGVIELNPPRRVHISPLGSNPPSSMTNDDETRQILDSVDALSDAEVLAIALNSSAPGH